MLGTIILLTACNDNKRANENLKQAFEFHQEAIKIRQMMDDQMTKLKANMDSLFVETYTKDLDSINRLLNSWDELLVEVSGFEEAHDHSGHDHHQDNLQQLTPEQHLEVQQHLLEEIKAIAEKVNNIKEQTQSTQDIL